MFQYSHIIVAVGLGFFTSQQFQAEELMAEGKELMEQLQKLGFNRPRPWKEFFAVLKPPKQWQKKEIEEVRRRRRERGCFF